VSRRHCLVRAVLCGGEIVDSANGTLVNGAPLKAGTLVLRDGDVIEVGGVPLAVVLGRGTDKASTDS
jgi:predicted component of type VI protein secretion system